MPQSQRWLLLLLLLLGVMVMSAVFVLLVLQSRLPSDGTLWLDFTSSSGDIETAFRADSVLQGGDKVLEINGVAVHSWLDRALTNDQPATWQVGDSLSYRITRKDGDFSEVLLVPLKPWAIGRLFLLRWGLYLAALGSLGVGVYSLLRFPHKPAARALFLGVLGLSVPLLLHMHVGFLVAPRLLFWQNMAKLLGRSLVAAGFLNVALVFPVSKAWLARRRYLLPVLYLFSPVVTFIIAFLLGDTPSQRLILAWQTTLWLNTAMVLAASGSVLHSYLNIPNDVVRGQLRWMGWGVLFGGLPYLLLTGLPELLTGHAWVNVGITALFMMLVPLTIAVAIARYRLFDVDAVVRRTSLFLLFALALTIVYRLLSVILMLSTRSMVGGFGGLVVVFITAFLVGMAFWTYQEQFSRMFSTFFHQRYVNPRGLLSDMGERLAQAIDLEDVKRLLNETIPAQLGASGGRLMLIDSLSDQLVTVKSTGFSLPGDAHDFMETWKRRGGHPLRLALLPSWVRPDIRAFMVTQHVELLFLLRSGDQVMGIWGLGSTSAHLPYATEEVRVLQALGRQAAVAIQNARLVAQLRERGQYLEAEMQRRMHLLERERNRLNAILQNMVDALLVTSPTGQIMMVNPAFEDLVHRSARHIIAQSVSQFLDSEGLEGALARAMEQPGRAEIVELKLDKRILRGAVIALRDSATVITILRDVTQEVELDRMKSELISSISHELRTPLTSILGFTRLIQRAFENHILDVLPDDPDVQRTQQRIIQNLDIMLEESQRLTDLIKDVLDIAALDADRVEWHDQFYNFPALLREIVDHIRPVVQEKGLEINLRIDRDVRHLRADHERIKQVLQNLLSNALKFTSEGSITVSAQALKPNQWVHGWQVPEGGAVQVKVSDTGVGIPQEAQKDLFQPFQKFDVLADQKPHGTGLGLVICREVITHYGGAIWVESESGQGSTFAFTLPVGAEPSAGASEAPSRQTDNTRTET
jgi:PAS domain S-box-containing protein